jgi:hypothetical protein
VQQNKDKDDYHQSIGNLIELYKEECQKAMHQDTVVFQIRVFAPTAAIALISIALNSKLYLIFLLTFFLMAIAGFIDLSQQRSGDFFMQRMTEIEKILKNYAGTNFYKNAENPANPYSLKRGQPKSKIMAALLNHPLTTYYLPYIMYASIGLVSLAAFIITIFIH